MKIGVLGATSQIGKDLISSLAMNEKNIITLFSRKPAEIESWAKFINVSNFIIKSLDSFPTNDLFDVVFNFIGSTSPANLAKLGPEIEAITTKYDLLVLNYLSSHPDCKYIFMSSGAVYGDNFENPVTENSKSIFPINDLQHYHWYGISKLNAEIRHRALPEFSIIDIRIFNYFSHTQDMTSGFFMAEIAKSIKEGIVLKTNGEMINRDYLTPEDFYGLICNILDIKDLNIGVDCYSLEPICKLSLLEFLSIKYALKYEITSEKHDVNVYGKRINYYSKSKIASNFNYQPKYSSLSGIEREIDLYLRLQY